MLHLQNCAQCRKLHLQKSVRCRFAHFVHDGFSHICRFAHLCFAHLQKSFEHVKTFFEKFRVCEMFLRMCATCEICFFTFCTEFANLSVFCKMTKKSKFPKMSENVPKKAHVFLSGTRVVPGPTRLTTQGGKSRQNMH